MTSTSDIVHPKFRELLEKLLPENEIGPFLASCRKPLKKSLCVNTHKIDVQTLFDTTKERGRHLIDPKLLDQQHTSSFYIDRDNTDTALGRTFLHQCGFFYIQEIAASLAAPQLDLQAGDMVLDMAAAPGGKTSQLANTLLQQDHPGLVVANDVNGKRLGSLAHNLNKGGCYNTLLTKFNGSSFGSNLPNFFDHVLLDAPCSGEGTGFKSDYAMKFWKKEEINKICGTQFQLLVSALKTVKVGGTVVYSTCTLNPYENELILAKILKFFKGNVELETVHAANLESGIAREEDEHAFTQPNQVARCWPHKQGTGGFFISKLRKLAPVSDKKPEKLHKLLPKNQFKIEQSRGIQKQVTQRLGDHFGITPDSEKHYFVATKEKVYLCSPSFKDVFPHLHAEKMGIPIAKRDRRLGFRATHHLGNTLGHLAGKQVTTLTTEQMQHYSEGNNILLDDVELDTSAQQSPYVIIQRQGYGMTIAKIVGQELKNKFLK